MLFLFLFAEAVVTAVFHLSQVLRDSYRVRNIFLRITSHIPFRKKIAISSRTLYVKSYSRVYHSSDMILRRRAQHYPLTFPVYPLRQ